MSPSKPVEGACQPPHVAERHTVNSTGFDPHHDAPRDSGRRRHVDLSQVPSEPKRPQRRPDALVLHRGTLNRRPYLGLTGCRFLA
jgi:hypothetical protein